ncbi:agouti-signaling protein-like [Cololabis saira]|uniref:agouti-signaling protein-like n=1 Tax=Cololabis saira TaxID=129043 RepID=UPI002AD2A459|nr:agouti-signaling protein-like [Cololabis saira]
MRITVLCLCVLHLANGSSGLKSPKGLQVSRNNLSLSGAQIAQSKDSMSHRGPLFARRGHYEQQKIHVAKPTASPHPQNHIPQSVKVKPGKPNCSPSGQSCLPQSGCCDLCATCHCRFFNAICFCRKTNSRCEQQQPITRKAKQRRKQKRTRRAL